MKTMLAVTMNISLGWATWVIVHEGNVLDIVMCVVAWVAVGLLYKLGAFE